MGSYSQKVGEKSNRLSDLFRVECAVELAFQAFKW